MGYINIVNNNNNNDKVEKQHSCFSKIWMLSEMKTNVNKLNHNPDEIPPTAHEEINQY